MDKNAPGNPDTLFNALAVALAEALKIAADTKDVKMAETASGILMIMNHVDKEKTEPINDSILLLHERAKMQAEGDLPSGD